MKDRRRPSWSNVVAVLAALWLGASCFSGCTTYVAAPVQRAPQSCVMVTHLPDSDSVTVGVYAPPCDRNADSVYYWRIELNPRCALHARFDADAGRANVQTACPPAPLGGTRLGMNPRG